jgi:hypothetical protein
MAYTPTQEQETQIEETQTQSTQVHEGGQTNAQSTKWRFLPAVGLFFLSPLVGEFLLGNLPITWLWTLLVLAPLYGGGTLLIREMARRLGWGWPSMVVLGLTYAVIEEAYVTQSLFNPNYVGLRLLDYGYIESLGISAWWSVFVLGIHTIWSTAVPIALVESLTPQTRRTPWLGTFGLIVTIILFGAGCFLTFMTQIQQDPFMATPMQFVVSGVVVALLIVIAYALSRVQLAAQLDRQAPSEIAAGGTAFLLSSAFMSLALLADPNIMPAVLNVTGKLALLAAGSWLIWQWSRRAGWSARHRLAVAGGLLMTYAWYGFVQVPSVPGTSPQMDTIGNVVFATAALVLLFVAWRRVSASSGESAQLPT